MKAKKLSECDVSLTKIVAYACILAIAVIGLCHRSAAEESAGPIRLNTCCGVHTTAEMRPEQAQFYCQLSGEGKEPSVSWEEVARVKAKPTPPSRSQPQRRRPFRSTDTRPTH